MTAASLIGLISLSVAAGTTVLRRLLLVLVVLTAMYAKRPDRRATAERLAHLLLSPWLRRGTQKSPELTQNSSLPSTKS
jgi:hypothetical protein